MTARVVVANPSSNPEMSAAATGLAREALLARYHVPLAFTSRQLAAIERLPDALVEPIRREATRRVVPDCVSPVHVRRTAPVSDVIRVATGRLAMMPETEKIAWGYRHARFFDRAVARKLGRVDDAILAVAGAATRQTLRKARSLGLDCWLDFPLPHHASAIATLQTEARLKPEYASTLQFVSGGNPAWLAPEVHHQAELAQHLLLLSSYARRTFAEAGVDERKMHVVPLGVDVELFQPAPRVDDGVFRVLFVGQITQRKGVSYLVDAFRAAALPRSELVLAGAIVGSAPWARIEGVRHAPPRPRAELPSLYATADVVVLPSLVEGFGLTALEAMACGRPVIVSEHTFGSDIVEDNIQGWTIPIRDPDAIVDRISLLARDPERRTAMGRAARTRAEEFTWARYGARISGLLRGSVP